MAPACHPPIHLVHLGGFLDLNGPRLATSQLRPRPGCPWIALQFSRARGMIPVWWQGHDPHTGQRGQPSQVQGRSPVTSSEAKGLRANLDGHRETWFSAPFRHRLTEVDDRAPWHVPTWGSPTALPLGKGCPTSCLHRKGAPYSCHKCRALLRILPVAQCWARVG